MRNSGQSLRWLPPDHDPLAPREIVTTAYPAKRLIVVLRSDKKSDRYALCRFPDGSVSWRADIFTAPENPAEPERWIAYRGELTVSQVIELVPACRRSVLEWTRHEVQGGVAATYTDGIRAQERRVQSLDRLRCELEAAGPRAAGRAA